MIANPLDTLVTVFGGSGFLGRHVVRALAKRGYRIRVAVRRPELAGFLQPMGRVGQIHAVQANLRYPESVDAAVRDADVVINLVGHPVRARPAELRRRAGFGAEAVALAAAAHGARLVHVSALGADENAPSHYARAKAVGEKLVLAAVPSATIFRPSIVFGPEDDFFNKFAALARMSPVLPLIGGGHTRFQPVFVGDVASAIAAAVDGHAKAGTIYELGGPEVKTLQGADGVRAAPRSSAGGCWCRSRSRSPSSRHRSCNILPKPLLTPDQVELLARRQRRVGSGQERRPHARRRSASSRSRWRRSCRPICGASARPGSYGARMA